MLGIPTKSDVKDPNYQKAWEKEKIAEGLNSPLIPKNYIESALNKFYVKEDDSINPEEVMKLTQKEIQEKQNLIFKGKSCGIVNEKINIESNHHPNEIVYLEGHGARVVKYKTPVRPEEVKVKKRNKIQIKLGFSPYKIIVNPYELAMKELSTFSSQLEKGIKNYYLPNDLMKMKYTLDDFLDNANIELVKNSLLSTFVSPYSLEDEEGSEAYKIKQIHDNIQNESNISLDFYENHWKVKTQYGLEHHPLKQPLPNKYSIYDTTKFLEFEEPLKKLVDKELKKSGTVIFNGNIFDSWENLIRFYSAQENISPWANLNSGTIDC